MTAATTPPPVVVQKFGGTSVGSAERMMNVVSIVKLLEAADDILLPNSTMYLEIVDKLESNHLKAAREAVKGAEVLADLEKFIASECQRLRSFMSAAEIIDEISPRSRDVIISFGEKLSARIFSAVLTDQGVKSSFVNLDKVVQRQFDPKAIDQTFYTYLSERLAETIKALDPESVPVVTGYLGPVPGSLLVTIGRGYTDLTAALIAVGIGASELQIWKEVDGIFTADPRKVPSARLLSSISPDEAAEMTYYGSEVIHPFTMEQVIRARIPIRIKNTFRPAGDGTLILPKPGRLHGGGTPLSPARRPPDEGPRSATAVTIKDSVIIVNVHSNRKSVSHGFLAKIFSVLDRFGIVVDLISTSEVHVSMAISPNIAESKLEAALEELRHYGSVDSQGDMAIVSLVGREMRDSVGIASRMFGVLACKNVNIEMISQGASEINISCVVEASKAEVALRAIHDACVLLLPNDKQDSA
ncbi:Aspartokinase [Cladochytrium tenue]|nr:Aspartokinase [Cladochytrium tenue]